MKQASFFAKALDHRAADRVLLMLRVMAVAELRAAKARCVDPSGLCAPPLAGNRPQRSALLPL